MAKTAKIDLVQIGFGMILTAFIYRYSFLSDLPIIGLVNWTLVLEVVGIAVLLLQVFMNRYKPVMMIAFAIVGALISVSAINTKNTMYLLTFVLVIAAKRVNIRKMVRTDLKIRIPMTLIIVLLSVAGVITDRIEQRAGGALRHSLGFTHPNNYGAMLFVIALYWFFLRHRRFRPWDYAGIAALGLLCQILSDSRTSTAMIALIFVVEAADSIVHFFMKSDRIQKFLLKYGVLLLLIVPGISIYFGYCYNSGNLIHLALDQILSSRLYLAYVALKNNGLTLLGQYIEVIPWSIATVSETTNAIDNAYMYTLINFGIVVFILLIWSIWRIYRYSLSVDDRPVCLCLLIMIIAGFVENKVFHVGENLFMLYFASTLFMRKADGRRVQRHKRKKLKSVL